MITTIAICICLILSLLQKNRDDYISASIFSVMALFYDLANQIIPSDYYYTIAASLSFGCAYLITYYKCRSELSVIIVDFCISSILINIVGFCVYMANMSPFVYNNAFFVFYLLLIAALMMKGERNGIGDIFRLHQWRYIRDSIFNSKNHTVYNNIVQNDQIQRNNQEAK